MIRTKEQGFTLIEMSVVLVIIGLIVSGIVIGQTMIRSAQVMSVLTDAQTYIRAAKQFRDKYGTLPGDFAGATAIWGTMSGGCPSGGGTGTQTCNGNGDRNISGFTNTGSENALFWQHLANEGLIKGQYTGIIGAGTAGHPYYVFGTNAPASQVAGAGFDIYSMGPFVNNGWFYSGNYGHVLEFGSPSANGSAENSALTPAEAYSVDSKIDDGLPAYGNVMSNIGYGCDLSATETLAKYNIAYKTVQCDLLFITGF